MSKLNEIVKISIARATSQVSVADLNTVMILTRHTVSDERTIVFSDLDELTGYGFLPETAAYQAAQLIFSQNPKLDKVIVANALEGETWVEALQAAIDDNGDWLTLIAETRDGAEQLEIAKYIETTNKIYLTCYQPVFDENCNVIENAAGDIENETDIGHLIKVNNLERSWAFYKGDNSVMPEAAMIGAVAPAEAGTITVLHKQLKGIEPDAIGSQLKKALEDKRYTYFTTVHKKNITMGSAQVGFGEWVDVMYATCWLDARLSERIFTVFLNAGKIPYTNKGLERIASEVRAVLSQARDIGILSSDYDPIVSTPDATSLSSTVRNSRELNGVTFVAYLAGAIHKAVINGTVIA